MYCIVCIMKMQVTQYIYYIWEKRTVMAHICKKCFLREMAEEDAKMIEKYKNGIKEIDRVTEEIYESRLAVCKECELLNAGTCGACGCYVELRAAAKVGKCPHKLW